MASKQLQTSQVCDDEREKKRRLSNRESARRSRLRKQQRLDELNEQVKQMQEGKKKLSALIYDTSQLHRSLESENSVLKAQITELTDRLRSLNSVLDIAYEVRGRDLDIPDSMMEPWQLIQPSNASPDHHVHILR